MCLFHKNEFHERKIRAWTTKTDCICSSIVVAEVRFLPISSWIGPSITSAASPIIPTSSSPYKIYIPCWSRTSLLGSSTCPSLSGSTHLLAKLSDELPSLADGIGGSEDLNGQDRGADSCRYLGRGDRYGGPHRSHSYFCGMRPGASR